MKRHTSLIMSVLTLGVVGVQGQGNIAFNNLASGVVTVEWPFDFGWPYEPRFYGYAGAPFHVSLFWVPGSFSGTANELINSGTYFNAHAPMYGAGPLYEPDQSNGAGYFDGGAITIPGTTAGTYTFVAVGYANAPTFQAAILAGDMAGYSTPFTVTLVTEPTPLNTTVIPAFYVGPVPEPSSFALLGLGLAGLMIFRRRD